jgi:hypothetical protein
MGLSQQATEAFTEQQFDQAKTYYQRALAALQAPGPANEDLRTQFEGMLKALEAPIPKSSVAPKRAAPVKKAEATKK